MGLRPKQNSTATVVLLLCLLGVAVVRDARAQPPAHAPSAIVHQKTNFDEHVKIETPSEKVLQVPTLTRKTRSANGDDSTLRATSPRILSRSSYNKVLNPSSVNAPSSPNGIYGTNTADVLVGTGWTVLGSTERDHKKGQQATECPNKCQKWDPASKVCRLDFACHLRGGSDVTAPDHAAARIIKAAGCPSCHLSDYKGKCRVLLSCMLGYKNN